MIRALFYLRLTSLRNVLRAHAARLRQPKYLAGFLFAAAYFYFFFIRPTRTGGPAGAELFGPLPADVTPLLSGLAALALATLSAGMWFFASGQPGIRFSEAEIAFLFPAPVSRRTLVHYKVLSSLFSSLLQTLFFALIFNSQSLFSARAAQIIGAWWVVLTFVNLHYLAVTLTTARFAERGIGWRQRRGFLAVVLVGWLAGLGTWIWHEQPNVLLAPSLAQWGQELLESGPLSWVLWPFAWMVRPFFAHGAGAFLLALAPALLVLLLHYLWVTRINVAFEEAAIAAAARRTAHLTEALRTGKRSLSVQKAGRRPPFPIALARWPELAFAWKNLLSAHPWFTLRAWLNTAVLLIVGSFVLQHVLEHSYWMAGAPLATVGAVAGGAALFYGPLLSRMDLRQDLANADVLKTYPLPGWRIVLGELLAPTLILSGLIWLALLAWWLGLHGHQPPNLSPVWFSPGMRAVLAVCFAFITPPLVALELLVPNAAPVLLPGWFQSIRTPAAGIDLMGQRLIFGFGQVLVVLLALLPAIALAGLLTFILQAVAGVTVAVTVATGAALLVLLGELWCGVWLIGDRFEKLDIVEARP